MNKKIILGVLVAIAFVLPLQSEDKTGINKTTVMKDSEKRIDVTYSKLLRRIEASLGRYNLINNNNIKTVPFQVKYRWKDGVLELIKHKFLMNINGIAIDSYVIKTTRLHLKDKKISKIELTFEVKDYKRKDIRYISIIDPSPTSEDTRDIEINVKQGSVDLLNTKMGNMKNSVSYPLRNEFKDEFLLTHFREVDYLVTFIGESYLRSLSDSYREAEVLLNELN